MENNKHPFENVHLTPLDLAKAAGSWALELFQMHLLSPCSDHFQNPKGNTGAAPMLDKQLELGLGYDGHE